MRELLRSGQSIPAALELKTQARAGVIRRVAEAMLTGATTETNAEGYFAAVPTAFSQMDREIVQGGQAAGRLDDAMGHLSDYYGALAKTRRRLIVNTAYPIFILHFGALSLAVPSYVNGGMDAFVESLVWFLGVFYVAFAAVWLLFVAVLRAARVNPSADQMLQSLPAIGGARIALIGSRFCMLMGIMVKTGGSIFSAMKRSASASGSALFQRGAEQAVLAVQGGDGLGAAVMRTRAFPEAIDRAFQVGEASGRLDEEMVRQAGRYNEQFQTRLEVLSMWLPKLIFIAIAVALAFKIVSFYSAYYGQMNSLLQ
jgi:type II secretory pathway component PulF